MSNRMLAGLVVFLVIALVLLIVMVQQQAAPAREALRTRLWLEAYCVGRAADCFASHQDAADDCPLDSRDVFFACLDTMP